MSHPLPPRPAGMDRFVWVLVLLALLDTSTPAQGSEELSGGSLRPFDSSQEAADHLYRLLIQRDSLRKTRRLQCEKNIDVRVYRPDAHDAADYGEAASSAIHGRVVMEETGEPLGSSTVFLSDLMLGGATDIEGAFRLPLSAERRRSGSTLTIGASLIGYTTARASFALGPGESAEIEARLCMADDLQVNYVLPEIFPSTSPQYDSITEGGVLTQLGDYLVTLRRGMAHTVDVGGGRLVPVARTWPFGPTFDGKSVYDDRLFGRGADELVIF